MDRLPLASGEDLLHMSRDEKYSRYLYDLETVYAEVISTLGAGTSQVWEVEQTGGMCCVLSAHVKGSRNGVSGCFEFMVCPEGNLSIDDDPQNEDYVVGFMFCDEDGPIDDGEVLYGVSYSDLVSRVLDFMNAQGVKVSRGFVDSVVNRHALSCAQVLAGSWGEWRGDCDICGAVNAVGFCDRCTECAIESVYTNELEYGGTSEAVRDHLDIPYGSGRCVRFLDAVVGRTMEIQAMIWRGVAL